MAEQKLKQNRSYEVDPGAYSSSRNPRTLLVPLVGREMPKEAYWTTPPIVSFW